MLIAETHAPTRLRAWVSATTVGFGDHLGMREGYADAGGADA